MSGVLSFLSHTGVSGFAGKRVAESLQHPAVPPVPSAPNIDDAQIGAQQQQDAMRRRRGVLSNIYAGGQTNQTAPTTASKTLLGT